LTLAAMVLASVAAASSPPAAARSRLPFPTTPVPRLAMDDPQAFALVQREQPVILTNVSLIRPLVGRWTGKVWLGRSASPCPLPC
jgi:hypothetical protein